MEPVAFYHSTSHEVNYRFKALGTLFNQLMEAPLRSQDFAVLLEEMIEYLGPHFTFESLLMVQCGYRRTQRHEQAHVRIRMQIHALRHMVPEDPVLLPARRAFLTTCEAHLSLEDNELIQFANAYVIPEGRQITTTIIRRRSDSEGRLLQVVR